jgi:hypothetical protein
MAEHLQSLGVNRCHRRENRFGREQRLTAPVRLTVRSGGQQRLGPERRLALGGTVDDEFDSLQLQTIVVGAERLGGFVGYVGRTADEIRGEVLGQFRNLKEERSSIAVGKNAISLCSPVSPQPGRWWAWSPRPARPTTLPIEDCSAPTGFAPGFWDAYINPDHPCGCPQAAVLRAFKSGGV